MPLTAAEQTLANMGKVIAERAAERNLVFCGRRDGWDRPLACRFGRRARNDVVTDDCWRHIGSPQRTVASEIRRDAGFDGRDARPTRTPPCLNKPAFCPTLPMPPKKPHVA